MKKKAQKLSLGKLPKIRSPEQLRKLLLKKQKEQKGVRQSHGRGDTKRHR